MPILVAPYWNLNNRDTKYDLSFTGNISSSILEFKYSWKSWRVLISLILVAPYWNLNDFNFILKLKEIFILVAPYWNLNEVDYRFQFGLCLILVAPYWNLNLKFSFLDMI